MRVKNRISDPSEKLMERFIRRINKFGFGREF